MKNTFIQSVLKARDQFFSKGEWPLWISDQSKVAAKTFEDSELPARKHENWRYTPMTSLADVAFELPQGANKNLEESVQAFKNRVVLVNGMYAPEHSALPQCGSLSVNAISKVSPDKIPVLQTENCFDHLNQIFLGCGAVIKIKKNTVIKEPLYVVNIVDGEAGTEAALINSRIVVEVEQGSEVNIVECHTQPSDKKALNNVVSEYHVSHGAKLGLYQLQTLSKQATHIHKTNISQQADSQVSTLSCTLGSALSRYDINSSLEGERAEIFLNGLYAVKDSQHVDYHTSIDHRVPRAVSHQLYKGVLDDRSHAVFNGRVVVHEKAVETDSSQLNKNLLLSPKAVVDTKPQLEIANDDVKCAHGATVGQVSLDELFYFQSRGVPKEEAQRLLIHGFVDDVLTRISDNEIRNFFIDQMTERYFHD